MERDFHLYTEGRKDKTSPAGIFPHEWRHGGQFEHTLIIVDEGAELHYIEEVFLAQIQQKILTRGRRGNFVKEGRKSVIPA